MTRIHVVPHTHWDREWYKPFQYFRLKLVYVIDSILEIMEKDKDFSFFLLDGQTIVLDDYLQIKPENAHRLQKLIRERRLLIGPWYIQPDEFAPDGESLIRNLLIGINMSEAYGEPMMVGYLPDSFGQTSQMPHILRGFGIDSAVMMRGVDANRIKSSEFIWEGLNGDEVLSIYLPKGYSNGMFLPEGDFQGTLRLRRTARKMKEWAVTDNVLIMNGVDHQFPQAQTPRLVNNLNERSKQDTCEISTIENYIQAIRDENPELPRLKGELICPVHNRVHTSIASTRIYQKQKNRRIEALLEKYVEPAAVIGWVLNADYPTGLINNAWKTLLQNQTHDGICGCCTDAVHREMDQRFVDVETLGEDILTNFTRAIARKIPNDQIALMVYNNAMIRGQQLVKATVYVNKKHFMLRDANGEIIPYEIEKIEPVDLSEMSIWTLYMRTKDPAYKVDISFLAEFNFNVGYKVYEIVRGKADTPPAPSIKVNGNIIENDFSRVEIYKNGSLTLTDKETGIVYDNLHIFEDCGDAGDTYNFSPVRHDRVITSENSQAAFTVIASNSQQTTISIRQVLEVPISLTDDDQMRSDELVELHITTQMTLYAHNKRIDFRTEIDNTVRDHRLRVLFPSGIKTDHSFAETQFGTIRRENTIDTSRWKKEKWAEKPLPIYSQQRFVQVKNKDHGLVIFNRGLPEYEIYDGESSTIAITLIRSVGMMGKGDLLIRPGRPSGIAVPTPEAQCLGKQVLEYALLTHSANEPNITETAAQYDAPAFTVQSRLPFKKLRRRFGPLMSFISLETLTSHISDQLGEIKKSDFKLVTISEPHLVIGAVKKSEKEDALVIRLYNACQHTIDHATISFSVDVISGSTASFDEKTTGLLQKVKSNTFIIPPIKPNSALTLKFKISKSRF